MSPAPLLGIKPKTLRLPGRACAVELYPRPPLVGSIIFAVYSRCETKSCRSTLHVMLEGKATTGVDAVPLSPPAQLKPPPRVWRASSGGAAGTDTSRDSRPQTLCLSPSAAGLLHVWASVTLCKCPHLQKYAVRASSSLAP